MKARNEEWRDLTMTHLMQVDFAPLASSPDNPRWRNAAQWVRNSLVREGLFKADSPHGIWEISDAGRSQLTEVEQA